MAKAKRDAVDDDPFGMAEKKATIPPPGPMPGFPELLRGRAPAGQLPASILPPGAEEPASDDGHGNEVEPLQARIPRDASAGELPAIVDATRESIRLVDPTPLRGSVGDPADTIESRRFRVLKEVRVAGGLLRRGKIVDSRSHDVDVLLRYGVEMEPAEE